LKHFFDVLFTLVQKSGRLGLQLLNSDITQAFTRHWVVHHLKPFTVGNLFGIQQHTTTSGKLEEWLSERASTDVLICQHLARVVERMKRQADKHISEHEFVVGTMVYMKLQPYVQSSVLARANQKLSFTYFGPFRIIERIGSVAYLLQLPNTSSIHQVVHVSQLCLVADFKGQVCSQLLFNALQFRMTLQVLDSHTLTCGANQIAQVQIKWSEQPDELTTWEDYIALKQTFPNVPAWGQAGFQEPGNVSTSPSLMPSTDIASAQQRSSSQQIKFLIVRSSPRKKILSGPAQNGVKPSSWRMSEWHDKDACNPLLGVSKYVTNNYSLFLLKLSQLICSSFPYCDVLSLFQFRSLVTLVGC
jgi:hypothetical protein